MRAIEIAIHNFRSIHDTVIRLEPLSIIAGANNAGKSNVIDAIRLFYGDLKWNDERDTPKVPTEAADSWVEIEFQPSPEELVQLKDEYKSPNDTFRIRNYVKPSIGSGGKARSGCYAYEQGRLSENLFYGAKNVGSGKVGHIVYIPAVSKVDDSTKLSGPSVLRELVAEVLNKVVANSPAYLELQEAFANFEEGIKIQQSEDGQSLQALEIEITEELSSWDTTFNLGVQSLQPDEILKSLIKPQLVDQAHGAEVDQSRFGAGFQRHLIYTLIKLAARHANAPKAPAAKKKEFSPKLTWILFEEPEAFLHPSQEEVLHDSLLELVKDDTGTQVLLTTHSSRFVSRSVNDLTRLVRLRRDCGQTTAHQLSRSGLDELFSQTLADPMAAKTEVEGDAEKAARIAALKAELWLQPTRTAAFFSHRVILVEGTTEAALYSYLTTRGAMKDPTPGLTIVDCLGKFNIHRFMGLMNAFGIDHSVLYDGDDGKSHDAEVTKAISNACGPFTKLIKRLPHDIETELGIPKEGNSSSKPQHVLYHLEAGLVDSTKLTAVCQELTALATFE